MLNNKDKKILFFPQNNEHILNMDPVINFLEEERMNCCYIDTRNIYKQNLEFKLKEAVFSVEFPELSKSFYHLSSSERIKYLLGIKKNIRKLVDDFDVFVFGNDGAIQRLMIYYAKKQNKPCVMILDGLIGSSNYSYRDILLYSNQKFNDLKKQIKRSFVNWVSISFSGTRFSPFLPSVIGSSNLNETYVIGDFSLKHINKYKHRDSKLFSFGLPRMSVYFENRKKTFIPEILNSICFITSAYKWHGLQHFHRLQIEDIILIIKTIQESKENINFYIKIHPRENKKDYEFLLDYKNVFLVENEPIETTFERYNLLLSNVSTAIVEGLNKGVIVHSMMTNFPFWKFKNGILKSDSVSKLMTKEDLKNCIIESVKRKQVTYNENSENEFLSKQTPKSAYYISKKILELIK